MLHSTLSTRNFDGLFLHKFLMGVFISFLCVLHSTTTWAEPVKVSSCTEWQQAWPEVLKKAREFPSHTAPRMRILKQSLTSHGKLCQASLPEFFARLEEVQAVAPEFTATLGKHGQIVPFMPAHLRQNSPELGINVISYEPLLRWLLNASREEAHARACPLKQLTNRAELPPAACQAAWLYAVLAQSERVFAEKKSSAHQKSQELLVHIINADLPKLQSWPTLWSTAWPEGWPQGAEALLAGRTSRDLALLLAENATALLPLFKGFPRLPDGRFCSVALSIISELKQHLSSPLLDDSALRLAGAIAAQTCPTDHPTQKLVNAARNSIPESYAYAAVSTPYSDASLLQCVNDALQDDLALRADLGLHFGYGTRDDQREISGAPETVLEYVQDSIVMNYLRSVAALPWARTLTDIDDRALQLQFISQVLWELGRRPDPGNRFLQFAFLSFADVADQPQHGTPASDLLVRQIREESTSLASQLPPMRALAYEIHNGLHAGLAAAVRELATSLSASEKPRYDSSLVALASKIDLFFRRHEVSTNYLRSLVFPLGSMQPNLQKELIKKLDRIDSTKTERLSLWLNLSERLFTELRLFETSQRANAVRKSGPAIGASQALLYLQLLRVTAELNSIIGAALGNPLLSNQPTLRSNQIQRKYLRHLYNYSGIAQKPNRTLEQALGEVTSELQQMFRPRLARFDWFLWLQAHRAVKNSEYLLSSSYRRAALPFAVEKLMRDSGLHLGTHLIPPPNDLPWRAMNSGVAFGTLVFVPKEKLPYHAYRPDEILMTDGIPLNLGVTAGLITEVFQPRASHVDLRTRERGTPNAFIRNAHVRWANLEGKYVRLEVSDTGVTIVAAPQADARKNNEAPLVKTEIPAIDETASMPVSNDKDEASTTISQVGAKAFGYANLRRIFGNKNLVAPALFIPFGKYLKTARGPEVDKQIVSLLRDKDRIAASDLQDRLKEVRSLIKAQTKSATFLNSAWYQDLLKQLENLADATIQEGHGKDWSRTAACFRFRSSTNSEDLVNFQGAGLYESKTGCLHPEVSDVAHPKNVAEALGGVWASLWTERAFNEREHYGIDHRQVGMAVLVHRNWNNEEANGVLLTRSLIDSSYLVSVQPGENLVTNPDGSRSGDEIVATLLSGQLAIVSRAAPKDGQQHLSPHELTELMQAGERIHQALTKTYRSSPRLPTLRFDVEFKFLPAEGSSNTRKLILKQARPTTG